MHRTTFEQTYKDTVWGGWLCWVVSKHTQGEDGWLCRVVRFLPPTLNPLKLRFGASYYAGTARSADTHTYRHADHLYLCMCQAHIHTCILACIHTYSHTNHTVHAYAQPYKRTHTCVHAYIHTDIYTQPYTHLHACMHTCSYNCTHIYIYIHTGRHPCRRTTGRTY